MTSTPDEIKEILGEKLDNLFQNLLSGARGDIQAFARDIAHDLTATANIADEEHREEVRQELFGQVRMLAEKNRIEANQRTLNIVDQVVDLGLDLAFRALGIPPGQQHDA